jgi:hypothetical protein
VGIGTLLYAVTIGPLTHVLIPALRIEDPATENPATAEHPAAEEAPATGQSSSPAPEPART